MFFASVTVGSIIDSGAGRCFGVGNLPSKTPFPDRVSFPGGSSLHNSLCLLFNLCIFSHRLQYCPAFLSPRSLLPAFSSFRWSLPSWNVFWGIVREKWSPIHLCRILGPPPKIEDFWGLVFIQSSWPTASKTSCGCSATQLYPILWWCMTCKVSFFVLHFISWSSPKSICIGLVMPCKPSPPLVTNFFYLPSGTFQHFTVFSTELHSLFQAKILCFQSASFFPQWRIKIDFLWVESCMNSLAERSLLFTALHFRTKRLLISLTFQFGWCHLQKLRLLIFLPSASDSQPTHTALVSHMHFCI